MSDILISIEDTTPITIDVGDTTPITVSIEGAAGVTTFTGLSDTPDSYSGQGNKFVKVNAGGTALEFVTSSATASWGAITGTLSNQTDLQSELTRIELTSLAYAIAL